MTAPRNVNKALEPVAGPEPVLSSVNNAREKARLACVLDREIDSLNPLIDEAQAKVDALKAKHADLGQQRTVHTTHAELFHEMAVDACRKHGWAEPLSLDKIVANIDREITAAEQESQDRLIATGPETTQAFPVVEAVA